MVEQSRSEGTLVDVRRATVEQLRDVRGGEVVDDAEGNEQNSGST